MYRSRGVYVKDLMKYRLPTPFTSAAHPTHVLSRFPFNKRRVTLNLQCLYGVDYLNEWPEDIYANIDIQTTASVASIYLLYAPNLFFYSLLIN
jgi:hypothetical protein